jgi:hypothetical protein
MLHCARPEWLARDKNPSLLRPFLSCKENEVKLIGPRSVHSQNFIKYVLTKVFKVIRLKFSRELFPNFSEKIFKLILLRSLVNTNFEDVML